jgi:hypothetical protein
MLTSINPLGERARRQSFAITAISYHVGSIVGAVLVAVLLMLVGRVLPLVPAGLLGALALIAAVIEWRRWKVPSMRRQVDENWLPRFRGWVYGMGFGFQLGLGVVTIITSASMYLYLLGLLALPGWSEAIVVGLVFGLSRALGLVLVSKAADPGTLRTVMGRLHQQFGTVSHMTAGVLAVAGLGLIWRSLV